MAKDTFYFSHDYNARTDIKIKNLIRKHGVTGYGVYWCIVEDLYNNANALPLDCEGIAYDLHEDVSLVESVIKNFNLFTIKEDVISSNSVQRRLDDRKERSANASKAARKRWAQSDSNAKEMQTHSDSNAIKERKGKEIKENIIVPTVSDFISYFTENGYTERLAQNAWEYYNENGWKDKNGNEVKNWKMKVRNNWFKDENKLQPRTVIMMHPQTGADCRFPETDKERLMKNGYGFKCYAN